ncbi:MAG: hypothetical protein II680_10220 [Clostridia bacterium]|nr:hypothetical protein [Clostridia bacterium]
MKTPPPKNRIRQLARSLKRIVTNPASILTVLTVAVMAVLLVFVVTDAFGIRGAILSVFTESEPDLSAENGAADSLPLLTKEPEENVHRMYWELTEENALDAIVPAPFYTRVIRVAYGWGDRFSARRWTLTVEGDCWRLSDPPDEIFCDGKRIYSQIAGYAAVTEGTSWETEIGAAAMEDLLSRVRSGELASEITVVSKRTIRLRTSGSDLISGLYEIDAESGLILNEQIRYGDVLIRSIATESCVVSEPYPTEEDYAQRIAEFAEKYPELVPAS